MAESLADLALAAGDGGPADRHGGAILGLWGLVEDLRELGAWADPDSFAGEADCGPLGSWREDRYPGLLPLEHWQAPIHFGRRAETRALLRRLVDPAVPRLQVITGLRGAASHPSCRLAFGAGSPRVGCRVFQTQPNSWSAPCSRGLRGNPSWP